MMSAVRVARAAGVSQIIVCTSTLHLKAFLMVQYKNYSTCRHQNILQLVTGYKSTVKAGMRMLYYLSAVMCLVGRMIRCASQRSLGGGEMKREYI